MKTTLIALTATAVMSFGSVALANETQGPVMLTDAQMDNVVAAGSIRNQRGDLLFVKRLSEDGYDIRAGRAYQSVSPPDPNLGQGMCRGVEGGGLTGATCY